MPRPVRVNEHGLVIKPSQRDCFGEHCPVAEQQGSCFVDRHHLYFPAANFKNDALHREFALNLDNIIWIARCAHNRYHADHRWARFPREEVMATFLDESRLRQDYESLLKMIGVKLEVITNSSISRENAERTQDQLLDLWQAHQEMFGKVTKLELIEFEPASIEELEEIEELIMIAA